MKTTLLKVLWKKEQNHWKLVSHMLTRFKGWLNKLTFGVVVTILICLAHYAFALMHTLWEIGLFFVARKAFKRNLQKLTLKV